MSRHILKMKINALEPEEEKESPEYFEKEQGQNKWINKVEIYGETLNLAGK